MPRALNLCGYVLILFCSPCSQCLRGGNGLFSGESSLGPFELSSMDAPIALNGKEPPPPSRQPPHKAA